MNRFLVTLSVYSAACYWSWHFNTWWLYPETVEFMNWGLWQIVLILLGPLSSLSFLGQGHFHPAFFGLWAITTMILLIIAWIASTRQNASGAWVFALFAWGFSGYWYYLGIMSI